MIENTTLVPLKDVLQCQIDPVPIDAFPSYNMAGVYSFGRGLFKREPLKCTETTYKFLNRLHKGNFVISQLKAWEGAITKIPSSFDGWFLSPQFPTFKADENRLDISYLDWYCKQPVVWEELKNEAKGIGARRDSVSPAKFLSLKVPLPSLEKQRRIVKFLDDQMAKIQMANELNKQSIIKTDMLMDAFINSLLKKIEENPNSQMMPLESACNLITDGTHDTPQYYDIGVPLITAKNVFYDRIDIKNVKYISLEDHIKYYKRCPSEKGDVLFINIGATTGTVKKIDVDIQFCLKNVALLKPNPNIIKSDFLVILLRGQSIRNQIINKQSQTCQPFLSLKELRALNVHIPALQEQENAIRLYNNIMNSMANLKLLHANTIGDLDSLKLSILNKTFG